MSLSEDIKDFGLDLGHSKVGITSIDSFPTYIEELESRYEMYAFHIEGSFQPLKGPDPKSVMPSAKSIVALVYDGFGSLSREMPRLSGLKRRWGYCRNHY